MLNKKNIAKVMAAATVLTATPVFAAETEADVVERIGEIKTQLRKGDEETKQLISDLRFLLSEGTKYQVKGDKAKGTNATGSTVEVKGSVYEVTMTVEDGVETIVNNIVELENAIDKLKLNSNGTIDKLYVKVYDKGHGLVDGKISAVNGDGEDIEFTSLLNSRVEEDGIVITAAEANTVTYDVEDLYDGEFLTEKGFELYSAVNNKIENLVSEEIKSMSVTTDSTIEVAETANKKEKSISFDIKVDYVDTAKDNEIYHIAITGTDLGDIRQLAKFLKGEEPVGTARIAGENRFKTAVKIAKQQMADEAVTRSGNTNVVLVNAESMIDGLTATPLANALNAPVLLTNAKEVQEDTLAYIKELKDSGTVNVTIVGGDKVIENSVVRQLETMGISVDRVGGKDRHSTSVEVAIKIAERYAIDDAFIVAADGEADAMSIAPVAASKYAPIIVEGFEGMSTTAKELLKTANTNKDVDIIGGKVSAETKELYKKGDLVAGDDRYDTNAKVVQKYYTADTVEKIYVAKDGMAKKSELVDALAVGMLALEEKAPIILATNDLSVRQIEAVKSVTADETTREVVQIGGGVNFSKAIKTVAKLLGYAKN